MCFMFFFYYRWECNKMNSNPQNVELPFEELLIIFHCKFSLSKSSANTKYLCPLCTSWALLYIQILSIFLFIQYISVSGHVSTFLQFLHHEPPNCENCFPSHLPSLPGFYSTFHDWYRSMGRSKASYTWSTKCCDLVLIFSYFAFESVLILGNYRYITSPCNFPGNIFGSGFPLPPS